MSPSLFSVPELLVACTSHSGPQTLRYSNSPVPWEIQWGSRDAICAGHQLCAIANQPLHAALTGANYVISTAGTYALRNGAVRAVTGPPVLLVSDLDGTMVGDDTATAAFKQWCVGIRPSACAFGVCGMLVCDGTVTAALRRSV